jgi:hypothetical protein
MLVHVIIVFCLVRLSLASLLAAVEGSVMRHEMSRAMQPDSYHQKINEQCRMMRRQQEAAWDDAVRRGARVA